jgi:putative addiction module killer protein
MRVLEYTDAYRRWFDRLDRHAAAKVAVARARLELGNTSAVKWLGGIGEYRIDWGPGYRIYLAQDGAQLIVLFGGGTKRSQDKDIARAQRLYEAYQAEKKVAKKPPRRR